MLSGFEGRPLLFRRSFFGGSGKLTRRAFLVSTYLVTFSLSACNQQSGSAPVPEPASENVSSDRLAPCPDTPNCVSSQAVEQSHYLPPIQGTHGRDRTMKRVREIVEANPRAKVVEASPDFLRAEYTIPVFGFVDDVTFLWSAQENVLHVRSASRTGRWDLGVNRRRVERIRKAMAATDPAHP